MASNQIKGQEAIKKLAKSYEELAQRIDAAAKETNEFVSATQKLPSEYVKSIEKLKKSSEQYSKALSKTIDQQELYTKIQDESKRINNETIKTHAKLNKVMSDENKQLNILRNTLKIKNKIAREDAEITDKLTNEYRRQSIILNRLKDSYKNVALTEGEASKKARRLRTEITKLDKRLKGVDANVGEFKRSVGNYGKAMKSATSAAMGLARGLGFVGGAFLIADTIREAFNTLVEFDKQMIAVGKTTNIAGEGLTKLKNNIVELGGNLSGISIQGLAKSAEVAGQLGIKGSDNILKFSETIEKLKLTSDIVGDDSVRQFAKFIEVSNDSVKNADKLGSVITELGNNFATTERQILKNATEIQKGIAIYDVSAQSTLALGAATSALGSEAEQSRSAMQKGFKALNDAAVSGENLDRILQLTGLSLEEFTTKWSQNASGVFLDFIQGLNFASKNGQDLSSILKELGLDAIRTEVVVGILAKNVDVLNEAFARGETEYENNIALGKEYKAATESISVAIEDVKDAFDLMVLSIDQGKGPISRFIKFTLKGLEHNLRMVATAFKGVRSELDSTFLKARKDQVSFFDQILGDDPEEKEATLKNFLAMYNQTIDTQRRNLSLLKTQAKFGQITEDEFDKKETQQLKDIEKTKAQIEVTKEYIKENDDLVKSIKMEKDELILSIMAMDENRKKADLLKLSLSDLRKIYKSLSDAKKGDGEIDEAAIRAALKRQRLEKKIQQELLKNKIEDQKRIISNEESSAIEVLEAVDERIRLEIELNRLKVSALEGTSEEIRLGEIKLQNELTDIVNKGLKDRADAQRKWEESVPDISPEEDEDPEDIARFAMGRENMINELVKSTERGFSELANLYDTDFEAFMKLYNDKAGVMTKFEQLSSDVADRMLGQLGQMYGIDLSLFKKLTEEKELSTAEWIELSGELAKGLVEALSADYTRDLENLRVQQDAALEYAGDNAAAREEIQRQFAEKEKDLRNKQAKADKETAMFRILINTATGVSAALASANVPLSILIGALGLAQLALVASKEVPQFKDGVRDFSGGPAILGDGGVSEVAVLPSGEAFKTPNTDTLYNLPKGTDVYKNEKEFEDALMNELSFNGILPSKNTLNVNIPNNDALTKDQFQQGIRALQNTINSGETSEIIFDEKGIHKYTKKNDKRIKKLNSRFNGKGRKV